MLNFGFVDGTYLEIFPSANLRLEDKKKPTPWGFFRETPVSAQIWENKKKSSGLGAQILLNFKKYLVSSAQFWRKSKKSAQFWIDQVKIKRKTSF